MLYALDTKFMEDGHSIQLISIGVVAEDGREFYKQVIEADYRRANAWVGQHVLPHLTDCPSGLWKTQHWGRVSQKTAWVCEFPQCPWLFRAQIATALVEFVGPSPTFLGYYSAYDWVTVCQMFGIMMALPKGWPMYCRDLRQWLDDHNLQDIKQPDDMTHHALSDARWIMDTYKTYNS